MRSSGVTIPGDGRGGGFHPLATNLRQRPTAQFQRQVPRPGQPGTGSKTRSTTRPTPAMVVDDPVTARKVTSRLLEQLTA